MSKGIELIAQERERQINQEGWTPERDQQHKNGELALAASCYALPPYCRDEKYLPWPWHQIWWKPTPDDRIRELQKAGALIAAEIDRLSAQGSNCHICGKEHQFYCDGCQKLACEDHFKKSLCDTCMNEMEAMTEEEREALNQECIELLERGELP